MSTKGNLLFINRVFPPDHGASGLRLFELCQGLAEQGWKITVLCGVGEKASAHPNIKVVRIKFGAAGEKPKLWQYPFLLTALLLRALRLERHDVVVTLTDPPMLALVSAILKKMKKCAVVHWVHDLYPDLLPAMGIKIPVLLPALKAASRKALNAHDVIIALGDDTRTILEKDGIATKKIGVIPNWPDVASAMIDKRKPAHHTAQNPFILEGCFTVLYSGNFGLVHDFADLIEAMKIVSVTPHPIRFIMAGDGRKFDSVRSRVEKMALTNVHFVRSQPKDKFIEMLLAGDVHVATQIPEAAGLVAPSKINSALGLGRPCLLIGSTKTSQAKLISEFEAGLVVDADDPHARFQLADAIISYATDPSRYAAAQDNALRAAKSISFDRALMTFDRLFSEVA
jgi:colanic acid biosynthesis glycosyl transferase WcaI